MDQANRFFATLVRAFLDFAELVLRLMLLLIHLLLRKQLSRGQLRRHAALSR
jgi:hypothetical protein